MNQAATVEIEQSDAGYALLIDREFKAPCAKVYAAWTDPAQLAKWWGPSGFTCPEVDWNPVEGARYRTCMKSPTDDVYCVGGVFEEVTPTSRLVFTWMWEGEGPTGGVDTRVTIELKDLGASTHLRLTHDLMPSEDAASGHRDGWCSSFEDLDALL